MSPIAARLRRGGADAASINDPFARTVSPGLGSTPEGYAYTHTVGVAADWAVNGLVGRLVTAAASTKIATLDGGYSDADFAVDVATAGGDAVFARVQDANNYFALAQVVTVTPTYCTYNQYGQDCPSLTCGACTFAGFNINVGCNGCAGTGTCSYECNGVITCFASASGCHVLSSTCSLQCGTVTTYTGRLYRVLGGSLTQLWSGTRQFARMRLVVHGTSLDVYDGSTALTSVTDTNLTAATKFGIGRLGTAGSGAPTFDNLALAPAA